MAFCTAANICGPLWAPKLFWVCRRAQEGSRPKLGCDPSPIAQCSLALGGISPRSWAYQCTCICACSVTKYMPCITPKIYFGHLIAVGMRCAIVVVAKPLFLISSQLISCGTSSNALLELASTGDVTSTGDPCMHVTNLARVVAVMLHVSFSTLHGFMFVSVSNGSQPDQHV